MRDVASGVLLLAIAAVAAWQAVPLTTGTLRHLGPGMLPQILAASIALIGVALVVRGLRGGAAAPLRWPLRAPVFVLGAAVAFGLAVRPLGLAVAGPLLVLVGAAASPDTRWGEAILFALAMTVFSVGLFRLFLGLPIPLAPWLIGY